MKRTLEYGSKVVAAGAALALFQTQVPLDILPEVLRHPPVYAALAFGTSYAATTDLRATLTAFLIAAFAFAYAQEEAEEENGTQGEEGDNGA